MPTTTPTRQSNHWQDWVNLILAIWLFISPWVLQFGSNVAPAVVGPQGNAAVPPAAAVVGNPAAAGWNAWILGVVIFLVAASALARLSLWQEWVNLILGIWLFIAPWALGFSNLANAAWDHWIVGVLVFLFALWDLGTIRSRSTATTNEAGYPAGRTSSHH